MIIDLGLVDYEEAYRIQKEFVHRRKLSEIEDSIILAEHNPVFTMGRAGHIENMLKGGIKVLRVDRGGDITFHGPGQLVVYPIIDLRRYGSDLHKYLRSLEEVVIMLLKEYSVYGHRVTGKTGVWVGDKKIASIGIAATNWITFHGLSINVNTDLGFFSMINPCGMRDVKMTSLSEVLGRSVSMSALKERLLSTIKFWEGSYDRSYAAELS